MQKTQIPLFAEERKRKIMNFIKTNTRCSVSELAKYLISPLQRYAVI